MAQIRQHKSTVHRLISAVPPCLSVLAMQQCSHVLAMQQCCHVSVLQQCNNAATSWQCNSAATSQPRLGNAAMSWHLKIGWFRVIKGDGLGDSPPADQHQLMDQQSSQSSSIVLSCLVLSCISLLGCSQVSLPCLALVRSITVFFAKNHSR